MTQLCIELDTLPSGERRDLANALLRAAWSAALESTRILLLDLFVEVDDRPSRTPDDADAPTTPATREPSLWRPMTSEPSPKQSPTSWQSAVS